MATRDPYALIGAATGGLAGYLLGRVFIPVPQRKRSRQFPQTEIFIHAQRLNARIATHNRASNSVDSCTSRFPSR